MNDEQYRALIRVQFSTALGPDSIWQPQTHHVEELHRHAADAISRAIDIAAHRPDSLPTGYILNGDPGVGKTHLLGWIREQVQAKGGFFFMPKLADGESFWDGAVHGVVNRLVGTDGNQLRRLLLALTDQAECDTDLQMRIAGPIRPEPEQVDIFLDALTERHPRLYECQDTLRALVLFRAGGPLRDIGDSYLMVSDGLAAEILDKWGFRHRERNAQRVFQDLIRLFAAAGPVVIALDQIDAIMAESARAGGAVATGHANSLMKLREETVRTIIVAACISTTWRYLSEHSVSSAVDRFSVLELRTKLPGPAVAAAIVAGHLAAQYGEVDFVAPHASWPIAPAAFRGEEVGHYTPRRLLQQVALHVKNCLDRNEISELTDFADLVDDTTSDVVLAPVDSSAFDTCFERLRDTADIVGPIDPAQEDDLMARLLVGALHCLVMERQDDRLTIDQPAVTGRALHARLRCTLDAELEVEKHWSLRAIAHPHHHAVQARLRAAVLESGIAAANDNRSLTILRNTAFSPGPKTRAMLTELAEANGMTLNIGHDDLRTFTALAAMFADPKPGFESWLRQRRPAGSTQLFRRVFADLPGPDDLGVRGTNGPELPQSGGGAQAVSPKTPEVIPGPAASTTDERRHSADLDDEAGVAVTPTGEGALRADTVLLGHGYIDGQEFRVPVELLRKHLALFAGSGSGKTVFLRWLIEELALQGVSSIVIDANNDLSRLGDPWPEKPAGWGAEQVARAERYLAETDVVVWTPRRRTGRPLVLQPLPDFSAVVDDADELRSAAEMAVADLLPRTGLARKAKAEQAKAVLLETLMHFAQTGGSRLEGLIALLAELPAGVSRVRRAVDLAAEMADGLAVAMINDPLFGGEGEPLDPGVLLAPAPGKKARVSVINFVGLPDTDQRAAFVSQLQVALFTHFKKNPARDRPLGGLLVLDEAQIFAPSGRETRATASTLMLAAQARKYGLGIAYATQAPKGLHNRVVGNTAIQFFGKLGTVVQMQAANAIAAAWGGHLDDIGHLSAGEFYGAAEGRPFRKLSTPLCSSHHPSSAPDEAEVLERARRGQDE
ncbi:ATP-binding protein [Nocardia sp. NPDC058666]|uniref:ATP-binding protein n=1 Tax=Nocardia sp. NPDC058666 TaxID=3346587 RepID=UPI00365CBE63